MTTAMRKTGSLILVGLGVGAALALVLPGRADAWVLVAPEAASEAERARACIAVRAEKVDIELTPYTARSTVHLSFTIDSTMPATLLVPAAAEGAGDPSATLDGN